MGADPGSIISGIVDEVPLWNQDGEEKNGANNTPNHVIISIIFNEGESIIEFLFYSGYLYMRYAVCTVQAGQNRGSASSEELHSPVAGKKVLEPVPGGSGRTGYLTCGEGRGGERGLEIVAPGIAVDIEHLTDAVEVRDGP